jgi:hypothetical protein
VAYEPRCNVGASAANSAAAKKEMRRSSNNRFAVAQTKAVTPSMQARDSSRAAASPPRRSAMAPIGG